MRLTQYLTEFQDTDKQGNSRVNKISATDAADMIQRRCKKALNDFIKGTHIQRYDYKAPGIKYGFLDASKMPPRLSRNTLNYYTLIINDDPIWKSFPRRQVICTLKTGTGGRIYPNSGEFVIFPFDGVKVGVCNNIDMWDSFPELKKNRINARRFNDFIRVFLTFNQPGAAVGYDSSLKEFKKACNIFDQVIDKNPERLTDLLENFPSGFRNSLNTLSEYDGDFYKFVLKYYNPFGFKVGQPGSYKGSDQNEVWLEGTAIYVNKVEVEDLIHGI